MSILPWNKNWIFALIVYVGILSSIFFSRSLNRLITEQLQLVVFVTGLVLTFIFTFVYGWFNKNKFLLSFLWIGVLIVMILIFLRLSTSERSHMFEYNILSVFIFNAFNHRITNSYMKSGIFTAITCLILGILDECIQIFAPYRYFDWNDILFNGLVIICTISFLILIIKIQRR